MADKKLDADHPQRRKPRKRPKAIRAKQPPPAEATTGAQKFAPPRTAGTAMPQMFHVTGISCVDESQHRTTLYDYTGPDRRDPFWTDLAADLTLARTRFYRWLRTKAANGIAWCAVKLMRLGAMVAPDA